MNCWAEIEYHIVSIGGCIKQCGFETWMRNFGKEFEKLPLEILRPGFEPRLGKLYPIHIKIFSKI
jgi:hypothetical protein